jgi:hypothetical protein
LMVFPNLFILQADLRIIQPISATETAFYHYFVSLKGASPEINTMRLRRHEHAYGPGGLVSPDDAEIYERNQAALEARVDEWVLLQRGRHRETADENGLRVSHQTDETTQRAIWRHYKQLMQRP